MPAAVPTTPPRAPSRVLRPVDNICKWVSGLLLQYKNTSFSIGSVIDKERSMYRNDPAPDNVEAYKSSLTFALESLTEESNKAANDPLPTPSHIARSIASPLLSSVPHATLPLPRVNYGTSSFPTFNRSADQ